MTPNKDEQKLKEFCVEGNLEEYKSVLELIFNEIEVKGCRVSSRTDEHSSQHIFEKDRCRIRVSLQKKYEDPLEIIWTILHEFGHHLSGRSNVSKFTREQKIEREVLVWDIAEKYVNNYRQLFEKMESFQQFKNYCLKTYADNYPDR